MIFSSLDSVKQRIDRNYEFVEELKKMLWKQVNGEEKLKLISLIGKINAEYVTGVYADSFLEQCAMDIGERISTPVSGKQQEGQILIVMSMAAEVGGHTVLVHNWIKWDDENSYSIAFTNMDESRLPLFLKETVQKSGGEIFFLSGGIIHKAKILREISQKYQRIILFSHMEDIIPVAAYGCTDWQVPIYFYNHADFRFSYGVSVADAVLNLFEFDRDKSVCYRGVNNKDSLYFPFPGNEIMETGRRKIEKSELKNKVYQKYGIKLNEKLIVSMGADFKYENVIGFAFDMFVEELLSQCKMECTFLIIGADNKKEKWIHLYEKTGGKARALGILPRDEANQIISAADLYIVSFPMMASGRMDALQAGVPGLCLDIIGRSVEKNEVWSAGSIKELLEKSLDVLNGHGDKYLYMQFFPSWTREEWKKEWKKIYNKVDRHTFHSFYPERHIEKQEYINCQLLQEQAAAAVFSYIMSIRLESDVLETLYQFDKKYDMGIIDEHMRYLQKESDNYKEMSKKHMEMSEKHLRLFKTALEWLEVKRKGKKIDVYLSEHGYHTIAIYGMGSLGQSLVKELDGGLLKIVCGIDRNAQRGHSMLPVYAPADLPVKADLIINTTTVENGVIMEGFARQDMEMMQFGELLDMMDES